MSQPSRVPAILAEQSALVTDPFRLVDVGVSGGLHEISAAFVPNLIAVGFDALEEEIRRLTDSSNDPRVTFEWTMVGTPTWTPRARASEGVFERSTAAEFGRVTGRDYVQEVFNQGVSPTIAEHVIGIDDWLRASGWPSIDFLKIDTDGHDLGVVRSASTALAECLGVLIETPFDGVDGPDANTFWNIARELRNAGLHLYDLSVWRYSKAALPMPFQYEIAAQTTAGQVYFGDALFLRDLAVEGRPILAQVLKMVGILDHFGLQDCAVELLASSNSTGLVSPDLSRRLELALGEVSELCGDPAEARRLFANDPTIFMPSRLDDLRSAGFLGGLEPVASEPTPVDTEAEQGGLLLDPGSSAVLTNQSLCESGMWGEGWYPPEEDGTWSMGTRSSVHVRFGEVPEGTELELGIMRGGERPGSLELAVVIDDALIGVISDVSAIARSYHVPLPTSRIRGRCCQVDFILSGSWIPSEACVNDDSRDLGVFLRSLGLARNRV